MRQVKSLLVLALTLVALTRYGVSAVMYSVTTHYADKDTSCGGTPYRINVEDTASGCSESDCAASVNGLYDGVASSTCTRDYQNEIWTQFGSSVYILNVMYHDSECSNFAYARAYLADGECQVESTSAWYTAKLEANGSATLHHFTSDACSPDDMFMSTDRATKEDLASGACDSSLSQWFTNQGTTAAPLVSATTSGSGSASTKPMRRRPLQPTLQAAQHLRILQTPTTQQPDQALPRWTRLPHQEMATPVWALEVSLASSVAASSPSQQCMRLFSIATAPSRSLASQPLQPNV
ncbi:hypothetical protein PRNP1_011738 [Phytophthora ramorum]